MKKKLFMTYFVIALATMIAMSITFIGKSYHSFIKQSEEGYMAQAELLGAILENKLHEEESDLEVFAKAYANDYDVRITIVSKAGDVIAETNADYDDMENHSNRIEIRKALAGEKYSVKRFSKTLNVECMYCAVPIDAEKFQGVLRISVPLEELKGLEFGFVKSALLTILAITIIIILMAIYFSNFVTSSNGFVI